MFKATLYAAQELFYKNDWKEDAKVCEKVIENVNIENAEKSKSEKPQHHTRHLDLYNHIIGDDDDPWVEYRFGICWFRSILLPFIFDIDCRAALLKCQMPDSPQDINFKDEQIIAWRNCKALLTNLLKYADNTLMPNVPANISVINVRPNTGRITAPLDCIFYLLLTCLHSYKSNVYLNPGMYGDTMNEAKKYLVNILTDFFAKKPFFEDKETKLNQIKPQESESVPFYIKKFGYFEKMPLVKDGMYTLRAVSLQNYNCLNVFKVSHMTTCFLRKQADPQGNFENVIALYKFDKPANKATEATKKIIKITVDDNNIITNQTNDFTFYDSLKFNITKGFRVGIYLHNDLVKHNLDISELKRIRDHMDYYPKLFAQANGGGKCRRLHLKKKQSSRKK